MRSFTLLSLAALSSCSYAAFSMKITRAPSPPVVSKRHVVKRSTILEVLGNNFTGQSYMATVTVGTPPQDISLAIDTGSSDTWVLSKSADLCTSKEVQQQEGTGCETPYDHTKSSTYKLVDADEFHITYGDQSGADGDYITDDFTIGDASIKALEMGLAKSANLTQGLLGIGYASNEASNDDDTPFIYPNIVDTMVSQGLIATTAYSLYLDDLNASSGSIIFGGLDSDKFHGDLVQLPIVSTTLRNGTQAYFEFGVALTSFVVDGQTLTTSSVAGYDAILDSGTSLTYLPSSLTRPLFRKLGAYDDSESTGLVFVDCDLLNTNSNATFDFGFGGSLPSSSSSSSSSSTTAKNVTIHVPYSEMILTQEKLGYSLDGYTPSNLPFTNVCVLGILPQEDEPYILGDTFLRSAYVVYDLKNNAIAMAQTNFDSDNSNVVDFTATQTSIPNVSGVASGVKVSATATGPVGGAGGAGGSGVSATGSGSSPTSSTSKSASVASVPAMDWSAVVVLGLSGAFAAVGGGLFLA